MDEAKDKNQRSTEIEAIGSLLEGYTSKLKMQYDDDREQVKQGQSTSLQIID